jgi:cellulose biosynthesis protein BcsQ
MTTTSLSDFSKTVSYESSRVPIVCYYNHKSGVGKSSTVFSHGMSMAETFGLKVLLVDCDAQCSLTRMVVGSQCTPYDKWINRPADGHRTMTQMMKELKSGHLLWSKIVLQQKGNVFLLCGDEDISSIDEDITLASKLGFPAFIRNCIGAPHHIICKAAVSCSADVVLVDLSSSDSMLNRSLLLSSTYIVTPYCRDVESVEGIRRLVKRLTDTGEDGWMSWRHQAVQGSAHVALRFPDTFPQLLGWVRFRYDEDSDVVEPGIVESMTRLAEATGRFKSSCGEFEIRKMDNLGGLLGTTLLVDDCFVMEMARKQCAPFEFTWMPLSRDTDSPSGVAYSKSIQRLYDMRYRLDDCVERMLQLMLLTRARKHRRPADDDVPDEYSPASPR